MYGIRVQAILWGIQIFGYYPDDNILQMGHLSKLENHEFVYFFPDDWINEVWDTQFTECQEMNLEVSHQHILKALHDVR